MPFCLRKVAIGKLYDAWAQEERWLVGEGHIRVPRRAAKPAASAEPAPKQLSAYDPDELKRKGVHSSNAHFAAYEGVSKPAYSLTASADGADAFDASFALETVDCAEALARPGDAAAQARPVTRFAEHAPLWLRFRG